VTPEWATGRNKKDKEGRTEDHPDYDNSTLYVPESELKRMTPTMR